VENIAANLATAAAGLLAAYLVTLLYGAVRQQARLQRHFEEQSALFRARADSLHKIHGMVLENLRLPRKLMKSRTVIQFI
jgi:hypothetical protein